MEGREIRKSLFTQSVWFAYSLDTGERPIINITESGVRGQFAGGLNPDVCLLGIAGDIYIVLDYPMMLLAALSFVNNLLNGFRPPHGVARLIKMLKIDFGFVVGELFGNEVLVEQAVDDSVARKDQVQ
jgi:hypothetical protein